MRGFSFLIAVCAWLLPVGAMAGAWPQAPGATQLIVSLEPGEAGRAYDASGDPTIPLTAWSENNATLFIDHGVSQHFTITGKVNFQDYKTATDRFSGLGSIELGGRWTVHKADDYVLAFGVSAEGLGKGRRNDFDTTARQGTDYDLRAYFGKSFRVRGVDAFVDLQAARHLRQYEAGQWRIDATLGLKPSARWMVLAQVFSGETDRRTWGRAAWLNSQVGIVRNFGARQEMSLQLAARRTVAGENVPAVNAVVLSLWRNF